MITGRHATRIAFLDVGQGATTVVSIPMTGEAVVVDCFDAANTLDYLKSQGVRHLRGLIITHLHLDHYASAVQFLDYCSAELGLECERLLINWLNCGTPKYLESVQDDHSEGFVPEPGRSHRRKRALAQIRDWAERNSRKTRSLAVEADSGALVPGDINDALTLIHPEHGQMPSLLAQGFNNTAAVLKVQGIGTSALLPSDIQPPGWQTLVKNYSDVRSDVLSFPHHGAWKGADPSEILEQIGPSIVVISVGTEGAKYGHPNREVFEAIRKRPGVRLMCTQAPAACDAHVEEKRSDVLNVTRQHERSMGRDALVCGHGCPCAGAVVIELAEEVRVAQPEYDFHRDAIIRPHFSTPQCSV